MKILLLKKDNLKSVAKILAESSWWGSVEEIKRDLLKKIKSKEVFIAIENKEILGVFIYTRDYSHHANYLDSIFVAKNYRGQGVSQRLLEKYISISRKETPQNQIYALSGTDFSNKPSINMHLRFGFKKIGRIKNLHYGEDEIFFGYDLRGGR